MTARSEPPDDGPMIEVFSLGAPPGHRRAMPRRPPVPGGFDDLADEKVTLLVQGRNTDGDEIYAYIHMEIARIHELQFKLASGKNFHPTEFGTVVAAGQGQPTEAVKAEIGESQFMIEFEPPSLPSLPPPGPAGEPRGESPPDA